MRRSWIVALDENAVEFLLACRAVHRRSLLRLFDTLKSNPALEGDFVELDDTGRELQVKVLGGFMVTFWADHAVKEIRVVEIDKAD